MSLLEKLRDFFRPLYANGSVGDKVVYLDLNFPEGQRIGDVSNYSKIPVLCTVIALDGNPEFHSITLRHPNGKELTTSFPNPDIRKPGFLEFLLNHK